MADNPPSHPRPNSGPLKSELDPVDPALGPASLQAPWRLEYLETVDAPKAAPSTSPTSSTGCFLRDYWLDPTSDLAHHVIARVADDPADAPGAPTGGLILLNAFPYAGGHLLVALGESRPRLLDYTPAQRAALWRLTDIAMDLMERTLEPQGINLGVNQGRAAGAGVPQHLHVHLVPRWGGDVNFITVVGRVRVIPTSLEAMSARYRGVRAGMQ
ncbi:MAG: HIT domain-containing protein [Phycisphaerales bacterium]|nr:HIT domain-containing protein [Phycisphaerales bacterium]